MGRIACACAVVFIGIAAAEAVLSGTASAARAQCEDRVLKDWSDNGRVDGMYPLHCYEIALATMPSDLRDYTNAGDAIQRALARASTRGSSASGPSRRLAAGGNVAGGPGPSAVPLPLVALAGVSLAVLAAGGVGWVARRRRGD